MRGSRTIAQQRVGGSGGISQTPGAVAGFHEQGCNGD